MRYEVISIGSATVDVFVQSEEFKLLKTKKVFTGEALLVPYGAKSEVSGLTVQSGGGGTNTAVGFTRLGVKAAVLARCGWDFAGKIVRDELEEEGVGGELLIQVEGDKTDYSTILIGPDGGRAILVYRGGTRIEERLINREKLRADWFYISSIEGNLALLNRLADYAHDQGIKVAVNPGRRELKQKRGLIRALNKVDVVVVNREEAARLTGLGIKSPNIFRAMAAVVKEMAVITDGSRGATLFTREEKMLRSEGFEVKMADSTGAGDGFGCGFVAGLIKGWGLEKALKLGVCNGAAAVTKIGAKTGLLREKEAEEWLKKPLKIEWKE